MKSKVSAPASIPPSTVTTLDDIASRDVVAPRLRLAELSSSLGAGVLGLGIGVLISSSVAGLGWPILVVGLVLHAWGMADKHRIEAKQGAPRVWWSTLLYWLCWVALAAIVLYAVWSWAS
jgi:hypothetical protein